MKITITRLDTGFDKKTCYVHARGLIMPSGFGIITMQRLDLSGCDVFSGLEMIKSSDGGKTFSPPVPCQNLTRKYDESGASVVMCDATPFYHRGTGRIILTGHTAAYGKDNKLRKAPRPRKTVYAVYNEDISDFGEYRELVMPGGDKEKYFSSGAGCAGILEEPNGDLLIPIYHKSYLDAHDDNAPFSVSVLRCTFEGDVIRVSEIGNELTVSEPRGVYEPSIAKHRGEYYLTLRNDKTGYVSHSTDGIHFDEPRELVFDNGLPVGSYNTQQHWLVGGGRLWLVYTRRAENNGHVFRHRAPLFIAEFNTDSLSVVRSTEMIAVPERGARLGNFGCQSYSDTEGYVFCSEWMQNGKLGWQKCAEYGSDNSIFISKISYLD